MLSESVSISVRNSPSLILISIERVVVLLLCYHTAKTFPSCSSYENSIPYRRFRHLTKGAACCELSQGRGANLTSDIELRRTVVGLVYPRRLPLQSTIEIISCERLFGWRTCTSNSPESDCLSITRYRKSVSFSQ